MALILLSVTVSFVAFFVLSALSEFMTQIVGRSKTRVVFHRMFVSVPCQVKPVEK